MKTTTSITALAKSALGKRRMMSTSVTPDRERAIAFIGLGAMGREMASNLFTKSLADTPTPTTFVVCDAVPEAAHAFARSFATLHPSAKLHVVENPAQ